jgi:NTE family protein
MLKDRGPDCIRRRINLALPGAGSHGALTFGAAERLLEEDWIDFDGLSATSSGGMNAVAIAHGWAVGGRRGAADTLRKMWGKVADAGRFGPYRRTMLEQSTGTWNMDSGIAAGMTGILQGYMSPYQFNPFNLSFLGDLLRSTIDVGAVRSSPISIFLTATSVESGAAHVFRNADFTIEAALASACLPEMFQAVMINGVSYWDGGLVGNPSLWPLALECASKDIVIIEANPLHRVGTPKSAVGIRNRQAEISYSHSLRSEIRALHLMGQAGGSPVHLHRIEAEKEIAALGSISRLNAEPDFIAYLRGLGRRAASQWLASGARDLGLQSSCDVSAVYLDGAFRATSAKERVQTCDVPLA